MTATTVDLELELAPRTLPPCMVEDDYETPCPMTGKNNCPSDPKEQAKCPQC